MKLKHCQNHKFNLFFFFTYLLQGDNFLTAVLDGRYSVRYHPVNTTKLSWPNNYGALPWLTSSRAQN